MKRFIFFARVFIGLTFVFPFSAMGQNNASDPYYVVIGAFAIQRNAINFRGEAKTNNYAARFELNPGRNLFYVYVLNTADRELAIVEALKLREKTKYFDTWVYNGFLGKSEGAPNLNSGIDINPVTGQSFQSKGIEQNNSPDRNSDAVNISPDTQINNQALSTTTEKRGSATTPEQAPKINQQRSAGTSKPDPSKTNSNAISKADQENTETEPDSSTSSEKESALSTKNSDALNQNIVSIEKVTKKNESLSAANPPESSKKTNTGLSTAGLGDAKNERDATATDEQKSQSATQKNSTKLSGNIVSPDGVIKKNEESSAFAGPQKSSINTNKDVSKVGKIDPQTEKNAASTSGQVTESGKLDGQQSSSKTKSNLNPGTTALKSESASKQNAADSLNNKDVSGIAEKTTRLAEASEPLSSEDVIGKNFYFKLFRASNRAVVEGEVDAIDSEKSRKMATYKANTLVKVLMPPGKSKIILFVSEVFGYRKLQKVFNPNDPSEELYLDENGNLVVPFELVRLQKGDIAIMYNVFFFKDAAVMRPESRYEVNNLLDLLNENPSYKIVIHGHTNGNANGKILRMGNIENFYSLTGVEEGFGSSKKLSEERALVMKQYLLSKGIADDRIQIKAWGGKKPIHDKNGVRAQENVRVEIEILSE